VLTLALSLLLACATHDVPDADVGAAAPSATAPVDAPADVEDPPGTPGPVSDASVEIATLPPETTTGDASAEGEDAPADASPDTTADTPDASAGSDAGATSAAQTTGCLADSDCGADMICEGQGCDDDQPGTCVPAVRACTKDLRPYCGCDDKTFLSSGSCPGRRYQAAMPCPGDPAPTTPGSAR